MNRDRLKEILKEEITKYLNESISGTYPEPRGQINFEPATPSGKRLEKGLAAALEKIPMFKQGLADGNYRAVRDAFLEVAEAVVNMSGAGIEEMSQALDRALTSARGQLAQKVQDASEAAAKPAERTAIPTGGEVAGGKPAARTASPRTSTTQQTRRRKADRPQARRIRNESNKADSAKKDNKKKK